VTGELAEVYAYSALEMSQARITGLVLNGAIAFILNVVSFSANKKTSALTMTVAGAFCSFAMGFRADPAQGM
jgi:hypothetical protein